MIPCKFVLGMKTTKKFFCDEKGVSIFLSFLLLFLSRARFVTKAAFVFISAAL